MKRLVVAIVLIISFFSYGQEIEKRDPKEKNSSVQSNQKFDLGESSDSNSQTKPKRLPNLDETHYKFISIENDTTHLDTTLTIKKEYLHNYIRKDLFELLPFQNMGQPFNRLGYTFSKQASTLPQIGVSAKQYNYLQVEAIKYYNVPTPFSEIMHKTGMERGQVLDALVTTNIKPSLNFFIGYKGLHSSGKYNRSLSSHGNFRLGFSFDKKRYGIRGHYAVQDLHNEENAGLTATGITGFETDDPHFNDRRRIAVNRTQDSTIFRGNRLYFDQYYKIIKKDSLNKTALTAFHRLQWERNSYLFEGRTTANDLFGIAYQNNIKDSTSFRIFSNKAGLKFQSKYLGTVTGSIDYFNYTYGYQRVLNLIGQIIPARLEGDALTVGGTWKNHLGGFYLHAKANATIGSLVNGNQLYVAAAYKLKDWQLKASLLNQEKTSNFNTLLYQSDYKSYNWFNDFTTVKTRNINIALSSKKWGTASVSITNLADYVYFDVSSTTGQAMPVQYGGTINYIKLKLDNDLHFGKFGLANTLQFQEVANGATVFKVPQFISRNSLYYTNYVFDNAMELQTGFTFKYFTAFQANDYNPLINEFVNQNTSEIGGYPMVDFFVNARVMRARIFLKADNITSSLTGRNYYSANYNPYHDFMVRFGIVWNFLR